MPAPHHPTTLRRISSHSPLTLPSPPSSPPAASTSPRPRHPGYLRAHSVSGVIGAVPLEHHSYWTSPSPRGRRDPHQNSTRDGNDADDSDFEDEFLRVGAGRGRARPRTMMVGVAAAREREEDSELLLEQEEGRVGLGLVGIEFPLSPPPEKRERMLRRDSTGTIETLGSRRSRSPSSVRNSGGSEGMTMRMLGHAKADASVGVQAQQVSSPSNSPLQERLSLSTWSAPNASPWTIDTHAATSRAPTSPGASAATASLAEVASWSRRNSATPIEDFIPPSPSLSSSSPTSSRGSSSRPPSRPATGDRATSAGPLGLTQYLSYGRRASLPLEPPVSPPSPTLLLPSPTLSAPRPPRPARTRDRSATAQLAAETFSQLRSSLSTSVLSISGAYHKGAPPLVPLPSPPPAPVRWESVLTIRISFTVGGPATGSANALLLGLVALERGGKRSWDPRVGAEKRIPTVVSAHGDPNSEPVVSVEYEGGGRKTLNPALLTPAEIIQSILAGPNQ